jgi:acyl-coenzyme A thioesterase PaaI-like protein
VTDDVPPAAESALELARLLGDRVLAPGAVAPEAVALVEAARDLVDAVVGTDVPPAARAAAAGELAAITARLREQRRDPVILLVRHDDGRIENLSQAGGGRLNPQAPRLVFVDLAPDEVVATCTLTAAHGGPPGKAHGGIVAGLLDEVLGVAAMVAGGAGLTAGLDVRYRAATPYSVPLTITARLTGRKGRKGFATGEIRAGDTVTAEATAVFVRPA